MSIVILFSFSILGVCFSYFIYPIILLLLDKGARTIEFEIDKNNLPKLSFIITAFNEEKHIAKKIDNTLLAEYPEENLEIIVASDGSTDKTNEIIKSYADQNVILHPVSQRKGKENAQRSAIQIANGDILIFSDVSTQIETNAFYQIVKSFKNENVGAVSSEDRFINENGEIAGEGAYVKYEMWLRKLESNINTLVGLSGSFFAARKEVCENWNISIPSDFNTALNCVKKGFVAISDPNLLGYYPNLEDESKEYQRKVRTVIRGIAALFSQASVMNPKQYGFFSFQVISHKLMRWLVPWFLLLTLLSNLFLLKYGTFFQFSLFVQFVFYSLAILAWKSERIRIYSFAKIPYFFMQVNIAIAHATLKFMTGTRVTLWTPSKR